MDAFDADVLRVGQGKLDNPPTGSVATSQGEAELPGLLIYAAVPGHPVGRRVLALFPSDTDPATPLAGIGSVLLLPEILTKPIREEATTEIAALVALLGRLDLRPLDRATAELAVALGSDYRLKAADKRPTERGQLEVVEPVGVSASVSQMEWLVDSPPRSAVRVPLTSMREPGLWAASSSPPPQRSAGQL